MTYYNKKEFKLAEKYYQDTLKIEPEFAIALRGLGKTYIATGRIPEAVMILEKAVRDSPRFAELYFDLANAYTLSREYKKALDAYKKVIELAPNTPLAVEAQKEIKGLRRQWQPVICADYYCFYSSFRGFATECLAHCWFVFGSRHP